MRRSSRYHKSLDRPQLLAGVPELAFMVIGLTGCFLFIARMYPYLPAIAILWALARWLTKRDPAWMEMLRNYLNESHVYDSIPRPRQYLKRPEGWGRGLPW